MEGATDEEVRVLRSRFDRGAMYMKEIQREGATVEEVEAFFTGLAGIKPGHEKRFSFCGLRLLYDGKRFLGIPNERRFRRSEIASYEALFCSASACSTELSRRVFLRVFCES